MRNTLIISLALVVPIGLFVFSLNHSAIDFNTQVKPILNKNCITCHGGVRKQADFSLLFPSEALAKTKSGKYAIVPGHPEQS
ncbi:MAG TPA: c-type cytochrome domain-containing protein, partial [Flavisolibacter sp.]|nr:c-type cytochrome domain-containing protein [Flavisolibacter sp.]